jgi:putative aldouronate transport system substrate-binding protein
VLITVSVSCTGGKSETTDEFAANTAIAGRRRSRSSDQDDVVIRWHGSRGLPNEDATIIPMLEELITEKVGYTVRFELTGTDESNHHPQLEQMLASNDLPDCFLYMSLNEEFLSQAAAKFDLPEMFIHMPELTKYLRGLMNQLGLNEGAIWKMYIDDADGMMWGVPRTWDYGWVPSGQMWRTDILDDLGYGIPTSIAEAERVFESYKLMYPSKYALGGSGKQPAWQCFDIVFNAYGLVAGGQHVRNGRIVQFFAADEFREVLSVLRRWFEKGFIDPGFINHTNLDKFRAFGRGEYLVTEWLGRGEWDFAQDQTGGYLSGLRNVPDAMAVAATHLSASQYAKPIQRVWNPFLTQVTAFGKHLEDDVQKIYQIMEVADLISQDREVKYLSSYGIEGIHYRIEEGETAPTAIPIPGSGSPVKNFGYGFYWAGTFSTASPLRTRDQKTIDDYVLNPEGIYGSSNLELWFPIVKGPVTYENGETVEIVAMTGWFEMLVDIVTGKQPVEYYDEWLLQYYRSGGEEWEKHATRLYLD